MDMGNDEAHNIGTNILNLKFFKFNFFIYSCDFLTTKRFFEIFKRIKSNVDVNANKSRRVKDSLI